LPEIAWHTGERAALRSLYELAENSPERLEAAIGQGRVLAATEDGEIVAFLQLVGPDDEIELIGMAVAEDRQGTGIGRALVARAAAECRAEGSRSLLVSTAAAATGTLRFYQRQGFRMLRIERDAFTPADGYPKGFALDGIPLRDRVWLSLEL
jgi:GNAT superfamily N-acetyltransferase